MIRKFPGRFIFLLFAICAGGCETSKNLQGAANDIPAAGPAVSPETVAAGRNVYVLKCARCHRFYDPAQYSDADWRDWMQKMSRKAHLTADQESLVGEYLLSFRSTHASGANHSN